MKKASTYLYAVMAVANVAVALLVSHTVRFMIRTYQDFGSLDALPVVSRQLIVVPWWPYIFVVIGIGGCITSLVSQIRSSVLSHALCIIFTVEVLLLAITKFGACYPMYIPEPRIIQ